MLKKILIIEDEENLAKAIQAFLSKHDYQVHYITDGVNSIEDVRKTSPDLILTDLLLPRLHGFDVIREIKEDPVFVEIPIIVMTAVYKGAEHKMEARRLGVTDFVEKPLDFDHLLKKVEKQIGPATPEPTPVQETKPQSASEPAPPLKPPEPTTIPDPDWLDDAGNIQPPPPEVRKSKPISNDKREQLMQQQFKNLKANYADQLPGKVLEIEKTWGEVMEGKDAETQIKALRQKIHSLAGSGTTFGFKDISEHAREMELMLDMIIVEGLDTLDRKKNRVNQIIDNMRHHPLVSTELEVLRLMRNQ